MLKKRAPITFLSADVTYREQSKVNIIQFIVLLIKEEQPSLSIANLVVYLSYGHFFVLINNYNYSDQQIVNTCTDM